MGQGLDLAGRKKDGTEFPVEVSELRRDRRGHPHHRLRHRLCERVAFRRTHPPGRQAGRAGDLSLRHRPRDQQPHHHRLPCRVAVLEAEGAPRRGAEGSRVILRHARRVHAGLLSFARQSAGPGAHEPEPGRGEIVSSPARTWAGAGRGHHEAGRDHAHHRGRRQCDRAGAAQPAHRPSAMGGAASHDRDGHLHRPVGAPHGTGYGSDPPEILPNLRSFFTTKPEAPGSVCRSTTGSCTITADVRSEVGKGTPSPSPSARRRPRT
jgi:hypothetical protein